MQTTVLDVVKVAICGWSETLRLCLIIVVAATITVYFYVMGIPVLPAFMR